MSIPLELCLKNSGETKIHSNKNKIVVTVINTQNELANTLCVFYLTNVTIWICSMKKMFPKASQNSVETTCRSTFLINLRSTVSNIIEIGLRQLYFPVNFRNIFKLIFLQNHSTGRMFLI